MNFLDFIIGVLVAAVLMVLFSATYTDGTKDGIAKVLKSCDYHGEYVVEDKGIVQVVYTCQKVVK